MAAGVLATGKSLRVAALTLLSVVWAESMTATSSSKGVECSSSVVGSGLAACRRRKIALARGGMHGGLRSPAWRRAWRAPSACARRAGRRALGRARAMRSLCASKRSRLRLARGGRGRIGERRPRHHRDAIDGAGRDAQLAAGAKLGDDGMHLLARADDGIDGAGRQALGAADAARLVDQRDERRALRRRWPG